MPPQCALIVPSHKWSVATAAPQVSDIWSPGLISPRREWLSASIMPQASPIKVMLGEIIGSFYYRKLIKPTTDHTSGNEKLSVVLIPQQDSGGFHSCDGGGGCGLPFLCSVSLEMPSLSSDETQRFLVGLQAVQVLPCLHWSPCALTIGNANHDSGIHPL